MIYLNKLIRQLSKSSFFFFLNDLKDEFIMSHLILTLIIKVLKRRS